MSTNGFPLKKLNKAFKRLLLKAFLFGSEKVSLKSVLCDSSPHLRVVTL